MTHPRQPDEAPTDLSKESAAGEEDPGAAIDSLHPVTTGDASPSGAPGAGKGPCPECSGSGRAESGGRCPVCDGIGTVTAGTGAF